MKKILELSGGGIRGIIPAILCAHIEKEAGKPLNQIFDFFSGTSTGAILATLYSAGIPANIVRDIYIQKGKALFKKNSMFKRVFSKNKAKYDRGPLQHEIRKHLCKNKIVYMKDLPSKVAMTAYGLYANRTHYITSWNSDHAFLKVLDVVSWSALTAANYFGKICVPAYKWPQYLDQKIIHTGEVFQDGGQGIHNCTARDALTTALYGLKWQKDDDIYLLSLGCGSVKLMADSYKSVANDGWLEQVSAYFSQARDESTYDQVHTASFMLSKTYNNLEHFTRINPRLSKKLDVLDGLSYINKYKDIGYALINQIPEIYVK